MYKKMVLLTCMITPLSLFCMDTNNGTAQAVANESEQAPANYTLKDFKQLLAQAPDESASSGTMHVNEAAAAAQRQQALPADFLSEMQKFHQIDRTLVCLCQDKDQLVIQVKKHHRKALQPVLASLLVALIAEGDKPLHERSIWLKDNDARILLEILDNLKQKRGEQTFTEQQVTRLAKLCKNKSYLTRFHFLSYRPHAPQLRKGIPSQLFMQPKATTSTTPTAATSEPTAASTTSTNETPTTTTTPVVEEPLTPAAAAAIAAAKAASEPAPTTTTTTTSQGAKPVEIDFKKEATNTESDDKTDSDSEESDTEDELANTPTQHPSRLEFFVNASCTYNSWKERALAAVLPGYYPTLKPISTTCESNHFIGTMQTAIQNLVACQRRLANIRWAKTAATGLLTAGIMHRWIAPTNSNRNLLTFGAAALCSAVAYGINKVREHCLYDRFEGEYLASLAIAVRQDVADNAKPAEQKERIFKFLPANVSFGAREHKMIDMVREIVDGPKE